MYVLYVLGLGDSMIVIHCRDYYDDDSTFLLS